VAVHVGQPIDQRVQPSPPSVGRQTVAHPEDLLEGLALNVLHDDVRGAVGLDVAMRPHDVHVSKAMKRPGLLDETVEAPSEERFAPGGRRGDAPAGLAPCRLSGEVLFERDRSVQLVVERQVRDAEAARAEHADDLVLADTVALRQRGGMLMRGHGVPILQLDLQPRHQSTSLPLHLQPRHPSAETGSGPALGGGVGPGLALRCVNRAEGRLDSLNEHQLYR